MSVILLSVKSWDEDVFWGIISVSSLLNRLLLLRFWRLFWWCEKNVVSPRPSDELPKLLEDQEVQNTACGDLVVVIAWDLVPMKSL